ncbi:MAG TPA: hypothetical protein VHE13_17765, partial [Opitutus sp.]|nr:hypothetical protein [Opitutus sp.]
AQSLDADQAANNPLVQTARSVMSVVLAIITNNAGGEFTGETDAAAAAQANITAAAGRTPVTEVDPNQVSVSHR